MAITYAWSILHKVQVILIKCLTLKVLILVLEFHNVTAAIHVHCTVCRARARAIEYACKYGTQKDIQKRKLKESHCNALGKNCTQEL